MIWRPELGNKVPVYKQIVHHFEGAITSGALAPGATLPTERELSRQIAVNRSTVTSAYNELRAMGLIQSVQGSGTRVSEHLWGVFPRPSLNWSEYVNTSFSPTLPLSARIRTAVATPDTINMATGELAPDLVPTATLERVLHQVSLGGHLDYPPAKGLTTLRTALARHLEAQYGLMAETEDILVTSGAQQAFQLLTQCILSTGDTVAVECPSYTYTLKFFAAAGIRMVRLPMDGQGLIPDAVLDLYEKNHIRAVFTNPTYQNPTGTTLPLSRRKKLLQICQQLRIPIVEIDFFQALTYPGSPEPPPPLAALPHGDGLVIHIGSLSDTVAPGIRIGWVMAPRTILDRLADVKHHMDLGTSAIPQQLTASFLERGHWQDNIATLRQELKMRRDCMVNAIHQLVGDTVTPLVPDGGGDLWCRLRHPVPEGALLEAAIRHGVVFSPGGIYGANSGFIRLSFSKCSEAEIVEGIRRFTLALREIKTGH